MGIFGGKKKESFDCNKTAQYFERNRKPGKDAFLKCPEWLEPEYDELGGYAQVPDQLFLIYDPLLQRRFYREGKVALGALVQANELLFKKGRNDCPANYIYTTDPYYWENPALLIGLAHALFETKGEQGYHPSIQRLADILEDEVERVFSYKLPRDVTEGRDVYFTTVIVQRDHLPYKRIIGKQYPLLVLEENQPDAMILPHWYWQG